MKHFIQFTDGNCTGGMVWAPNTPLITPTCDTFIGDIAITGPGCKCLPNFVWEVDQCVDRSECTRESYTVYNISIISNDPLYKVGHGEGI